MGKPSPRKQKKQRDRQHEAKESRLAQEKRNLDQERRARYQETYPAFRFDAADGDPEFVTLVKAAVGQLDFEDPSVFSAWERAVYKGIKRLGAQAAVTALDKAMAQQEKQGEAFARLGDIHFSLTLGEAVFTRIPRPELVKYVPVNDVLFAPAGRHIEVIFRSLLRTKGRFGTCYCSRRKPIIAIDGQPKIVAFSKHALEQICDRIVPEWWTYAGLGDVFAYFDQCVYFERSDLPNGDLAFTFYEQCYEDRFWQHCYMTQVLGTDCVDPDKGKCYYRVGYCPAVIEGDFIKAKTVLFPGFKKTPEYRAIERSSLPYSEKRALMDKATELDAAHLLRDNDLSIIKWFHDNGTPQVVQMKQELFAPITSNRRRKE